MKRMLTIAVLSFISLQVAAQDIHFSQMFETPLLRNPALAGLFQGDIRMQSVYRSQWNSVTNAYHTASANAEFKLPVGSGEDYLTLGGQALYDRAGTTDLTSTHLLPAFNYHKSLSAERNIYLSAAVMAGIVQRSIDRSKITTNSQFDGQVYNPNLSTGETFAAANYRYLDASAGMSLNAQLGDNIDNNFYLGLAYHHLNRPKNISFYTDVSRELAPKWVGSAGLRMSMTDYTFFTLEADYSRQGSNTEIIGGGLFSMKLDDPESPKYLIHGGVYMRYQDALIPVFKVESRPLAFAVSYDVNISPLKRVSNGRGGFELSLTWQKFLDRYNSSKDATRCPKF